MKRKILNLLSIAVLFLTTFFAAEAQILIKDITPGPGDTNMSFLEKVGNKMYFTIRDPSSELWVYDLEIDSLYMIGPVLPGVDGIPNSASLTLAFRDSLLVFSAGMSNSNDINLYVTNGSLESTQFIKTMPKGNSIDELIVFNNKFYYVASGGPDIYREVLWESDGTASGTKHLLNVAGKPANDPINFRTYNNRLWFTSDGRPWYVDDTSLQLADGYYNNTPNPLLKLFTSSDTEPAYFIQPYNDEENHRIVKVNPDASMVVVDTTLSKTADILGYKNQHLIFYEKNYEVSPYTAELKSLNANTGEITLLASFPFTNGSDFESAWTEGVDKVFISVRIDGVEDLWSSDGSPSGTSKMGVEST